MREWIEIVKYSYAKVGDYVSLCMREWIEIAVVVGLNLGDIVSLCMREWIEMAKGLRMYLMVISLPLYEGVD